MNNLNGAEVINMLIFNSNHITGRQKVLGELRELEKVNLSEEEQRKKANITQNILFENADFWKSEIAVIEQAEFCFDHTEAQMLITFMKAMFEYANPLGIPPSDEDFKKNQDALLSAIEAIKNSWVDTLKKELRLSYSEIKS